MELEIMALPEQNKLMQSYNNDNDFLHTYFDYENSESSYPERVAELNERSFKREELADTVQSFMEPFGISEVADRHIAELRSNAVTVIGGQQAGILTGPMFSVHKAITVVLLAKKKRESLGIPVVPVFWVAGEDHDLNEINHVYTETAGKLTKEQIREKFVLKLMASDANYNPEELRSFVKEVFIKYGETAYSKELLDDVLASISIEKTFTGFFVRLMNGLFAEEGLLFIDSAYLPLRELESDYFCTLIKKSSSIAKVIVNKESLFDKEGFGKPIDGQDNAANLFYVHETGRVLLTRRNDYFVNDNAGLRFTEEELLEIAKNKPFLLSNNVASRPLMQDLVFPVLAFVGGAGEIAYWSLLKEAFHILDLKMPIIVPRMSLTLVSRRTAKSLQELSFSIEDVMSGKVAAQKELFIEELKDDRFLSAVHDAEKALCEAYEKIGHIVGENELMMQSVLKKNLTFHQKQFDYLIEKDNEAIRLKHEVSIRAYSGIELELYPDETLQERIYTPYMYLNSYGPTLIKDLLKLPFKIDGTHKVIYL